MNASNRFNIETMARQRQAEIEGELRKAARLRYSSGPWSRRGRPLKLVAIGDATLSLLGTVTFLILAHVR